VTSPRGPPQSRNDSYHEETLTELEAIRRVLEDIRSLLEGD